MLAYLSATIAALAEETTRLQILVGTDPLTGLRNRRPFDEIKGCTFGERGSVWSRGAVLFMDVDQFGSYNKLYGDNPAGDEALKKVAAAISRTCRESDLVLRKGGEEFVAVLPQVDLEMALIAAERVRACVESLQIEHRASEFGVITITAGVSVGSGATPKRVGDCLSEASDLVMAAKRNGQRNQVHYSRR